MTPSTRHVNTMIFKQIKKTISIVILAAFLSSSIKAPAYAQVSGAPWMSKPGVMVRLSPEFTPAHLKGIVIHPENALKFDFIIHKGDQPLSDQEKREEYTKLTKYFLASLAVPDEDQWVNLSPYEKDRIIQDDFGKTEMGRDLLAQDYMLKQITASLIYPEDNLGKKFWDKVYTQAQQQFGTTNIPVNTFNKVWILPDDAVIYEKGNTAYVIKNHLKVMLEEDYLALDKHSGIQSAPKDNKTHSVASKIVKEIVLPELEREVNEGKNFAALRQVYSGMLLAAWYKRALKESLLSKIYANQSKVKGVEHQNPQANQEIYQQYLKAYKKGVFNFIKEDVDKLTKESIPRKYFSGGTQGFAKIVPRVIISIDPAQSADMAAVVNDSDLASIAAEESVVANQARSPNAAMTAEVTLGNSGKVMLRGDQFIWDSPSENRSQDAVNSIAFLRQYLMRVRVAEASNQDLEWDFLDSPDLIATMISNYIGIPTTTNQRGISSVIPKVKVPEFRSKLTQLIVNLCQLGIDHGGIALKQRMGIIQTFVDQLPTWFETENAPGQYSVIIPKSVIKAQPEVVPTEEVKKTVFNSLRNVPFLIGVAINPEVEESADSFTVGFTFNIDAAMTSPEDVKGLADRYKEKYSGALGGPAATDSALDILTSLASSQGVTPINILMLNANPALSVRFDSFQAHLFALANFSPTKPDQTSVISRYNEVGQRIAGPSYNSTKAIFLTLATFTPSNPTIDEVIKRWDEMATKFKNLGLNESVVVGLLTLAAFTPQAPNTENVYQSFEAMNKNFSGLGADYDPVKVAILTLAGHVAPEKDSKVIYKVYGQVGSLIAGRSYDGRAAAILTLAQVVQTVQDAAPASAAMTAEDNGNLTEDDKKKLEEFRIKKLEEALEDAEASLANARYYLDSATKDALIPLSKERMDTYLRDIDKFQNEVFRLRELLGKPLAQARPAVNIVVPNVITIPGLMAFKYLLKDENKSTSMIDALVLLQAGEVRKRLLESKTLIVEQVRNWAGFLYELKKNYGAKVSPSVFGEISELEAHVNDVLNGLFNKDGAKAQSATASIKGKAFSVPNMTSLIQAEQTILDSQMSQSDIDPQDRQRLEVRRTSLKRWIQYGGVETIKLTPSGQKVFIFISPNKKRLSELQSRINRWRPVNPKNVEALRENRALFDTLEAEIARLEIVVRVEETEGFLRSELEARLQEIPALIGSVRVKAEAEAEAKRGTRETLTDSNSRTANVRREVELLEAERYYLTKQLNSGQDAAMKPGVSAQTRDRLGGIDFNAANLNLQIKRDGQGVPLPISQQNLENIRIDGLIPVILDIKPISATPLLAELTTPQPQLLAKT